MSRIMTTAKNPQSNDKKKAKRIPLTKAGILNASLKLADEQGLEQLSMRKVAQSLGVEAMSLYNHIKNKDDLLDGILELVVSEFELPPIDQLSWKKSLRQAAISAHQVLLKHPWAAHQMISRVSVNPARLAWSNATIGCLHEAGFSYEITDHAWNAIDNHIYGFTLQSVNMPIDPEEFSDAAKHYLPMISEEQFPYLCAMANKVAEGKHSGINEFEFGLNLILDGLERLLED